MKKEIVNGEIDLRPEEIERLNELLQTLQERTNSELIIWNKSDNNNFDCQHSIDDQNYRILIRKSFRERSGIPDTDSYSFKVSEINAEEIPQFSYNCFKEDEAEQYGHFEQLQNVIEEKLKISKDALLLSRLKKSIEELD